MGKSNWSIKEIEYLIKNHRDEDYEVIAQKLNRTESSIKKKVNRLGLSSTGQWTMYEIMYIIYQYDLKKPIWNVEGLIQNISSRMGVSEDDVEKLLVQLGIIFRQEARINFKLVKKMSEKGYTAKEIAKKLSLHPSTLHDHVRKFNEKLNEDEKIDFSNKPKIPKKEHSALVKMYLQGMSCSEVAKKMGEKLEKDVNRKAVERRLDDMGIERRSPDDLVCLKREHDTRKMKLDLDRERDGWYLGWIISDGHCKDKNVSITQKFEKDENKETFRISLTAVLDGAHVSESDYKKDDKICTFTYCNLHFMENLGDYIYLNDGASNKKTETVHLKDEVKKNANHDFLRGLLRGVYEGDGSINPNNRRITLVYTKSEKLADDIRWICSELGVEKDDIHKGYIPRDDLWSIRAGKDGVVYELIELMYGCDRRRDLIHNFVQPRKRKKCKEVWNELLENPRNRIRARTQTSVLEFKDGMHKKK